MRSRSTSDSGHEHDPTRDDNHFMEGVGFPMNNNLSQTRFTYCLNARLIL